MKNYLIKIYNKLPKRFLIAGIINTIFGYFIGVINLYYFINIINLFYIGLLNNFLSITFAFFILKIFVFRTKNTNWLFEYLKSFLVYGFKGLLGVLILWICIDFIGLNIFVSQGISILLTIFVTYKGHKNFTFRV